MALWCPQSRPWTGGQGSPFSSLLPQVDCSALTCCSPRSGPAILDAERSWGTRAPNGQIWFQLFSEGGIVGCCSEQWISNTNRHPWCSSGQPCIAGLKECTTKVSVENLSQHRWGKKELWGWENISFSYISMFVCVLICTHNTCMCVHIYTCVYIHKHICMYRHTCVGV